MAVPQKARSAGGKQTERTLAHVIEAAARFRGRVTVLTGDQGVRPAARNPALVEPSHHPYFELAICFAGRMIVVGEEKIHELKRGDAVVVVPGAWHYESYRVAQQPYEVCWLVAHPRRINAVFTRYDRRLHIAHHSGPPSAADRALFEELARECRERPRHWEERARSLVLQLLIDLDRRFGESPPRQHARIDPVQKLARIVETRFREPLQIKSLSAEAGMSADHLSRRFRAACGVTFKGYLNAIRIHHAKLLLQAGWTVKRTAAACGFSDVYYFGRVFKRVCKTTPGRFAQTGSARPTGTSPAN